MSKKPEPKQEITVVEFPSFTLYIYTATDKAKALVHEEAPRFGRFRDDGLHDTLHLNMCYDLAEVKAYLEGLAV